MHGRIQRGVFARLATSGHPIRRQPDPTQRPDIGGEYIGQRLGNGHPARGRTVQYGDRRSFTHRHRLTRMTDMIGQRHGNVRDRHLPRSHHLIPADQPPDRPIADRNQECLVRDRRQAQHPVGCLPHIEPTKIERLGAPSNSADVALHAGRVAQQHLDRHVDRTVAK